METGCRRVQLCFVPESCVENNSGFISKRLVSVAACCVLWSEGFQILTTSCIFIAFTSSHRHFRKLDYKGNFLFLKIQCYSTLLKCTELLYFFPKDLKSLMWWISCNSNLQNHFQPGLILTGYLPVCLDDKLLGLRLLSFTVLYTDMQCGFDNWDSF